MTEGLPIVVLAVILNMGLGALLWLAERGQRKRPRESDMAARRTWDDVA